MLKKRFLLQTYFIILQCSWAIPSSTLNSVDNLVKAEVSPLIELLNKLTKIRNENSRERDLIKVKIITKMEEKIGQGIKERETVHELCRKEGETVKSMAVYVKVLRILNVRSQLETLVDDLYPGRRPFHISVAKACEEILTSDDPKFTSRPNIKVFRRRVSDCKISVFDFVNAVESIYGSMSDKAAHKLLEFEPQPPEYNDVDGIKKMYKDFGMKADPAKIIVAQIILEPLPMSSTTAPKTS